MANKARHSGDGKNPFVSCTHNVKGMCVASTLSSNDILYIKAQLYSTQDRFKQDAILLSYMDIQQCTRRRSKVGDVEKQKSRDVSVKYNLLKENKEKINVCKASFLSILCEYKLAAKT